MPKVITRENEQIEDAYKRFRREVSKSGITAIVRQRAFFIKPSLARKMRAKKFQSKKR
ncbi:MAG: 30S ribosomal protein S21 ['Waltheria sp.' little leaf phytoplasma]|nr:30S ribosomal protein S21 ['Waltheria sp.' little leaf phytoplasma]